VPLVVRAGATLEQTLPCYLGASMAAVLVAGSVVRVRYGRVSLPLDLSKLRRLIGLCWPFVVLAALQVVQFKIDTLMVFWILSSEAAAHCETAYRLLEVSRLAIRPLATIAFPVCVLLIARQDWTAARDYGGHGGRPRRHAGRAPRLRVDHGDRLGPGIRGHGWGPADPLLERLVGVMVANAMGQERRLMWLMGLATVFNVSTNAIAIPWLGTEGAAWTTLVTEILIVAGLAMTIRRALRAALLPVPSTG
jgi:O-antigen/teichoic acid export membrane protein